MITSFYLLLSSLALACFASHNFFLWPKPAGKTPLQLYHVLWGVVLLFLPGILPFITGSYSEVVARSLHGIFLVCAFIFYLLGLPIDVTRSVIYSANQPLATFSSAIVSAFRMWIIFLPMPTIIGYILNVFLTFLFSKEIFHEQILTQEVQQSLTSTTYDQGFFLSLSILVPFAEEIFFRGFLQTFLKNKMRREYALIYTSIIFALAHLEHSLGSLLFVPILFLFSLCAGFLYEKERHIAAPITFHILFNSTSIVMLFLRNY
ncbi:CPBP family intramembrane metalloprotease [Chlamydia gallinacea]|uniref:CPBP family intramembrane metalloprotease n=1 Tax=Chlamydia gallinacea TaxID=1457153 RepID=A0ABS7IQD2_9CHLA|nr:CPBP family intramembrane glutamic endopeptidase [Chlamydia gallinacea]MBX6679848.1 CPBP family intramembrane metalloprotease [Chlamydia gallinacea]